MYFTAEDIQARRTRLTAVWDNMLDTNEAVLVHSGAPIQKPGGLDQTYTFLPHPAYYWLTGRRRETEVVLYNRDQGWIEFQKAIPSEEAVWEGERRDLLVSQAGDSIENLESYLNDQKFGNVHQLGQISDIEAKAFELRTALDGVRRFKDAAEVRLIKQLADIANLGYKKVEEIIRPGISEKEIWLAYESEIYKNGSHTYPYETIVGSGSNSAILHALPTDRTVKENEFVLIDAGADIYDYCVDITRTYYSSENMSSQHQALYDLVYNAYSECVEMSTAGAMWRDVHCHAARVFTSGLSDMGILKGSLSDLEEKEVVQLFFPHGVGHLVGLRVRDAGQEENIDPKFYFGARLRVDLELKENHLVTVEPGCYFIKSLLNNPESRKKFKDDVDWQEVEKWIDIGGVRIEDDILVKVGGNENLTNQVKKMK
jgi:Xaa-Pro dipeptidase